MPKRKMTEEQPINIWAQENCLTEIFRQLPHRDSVRLERVSSLFRKSSRNSFRGSEQVALDFSQIIYKEPFTLECFQSVWDRYKEFNFNRPSRITALTVPRSLGDHDDLIIQRLSECYGFLGPQLLPSHNQRFVLRTLRLKYALRSSNDLDLFQQMLRNMPSLRVLELGLPECLFDETEGECYVWVKDLFGDVQLQELVELHLIGLDGYPHLDGPSFGSWTPNLKILNAYGFYKNEYSFDDTQDPPKCSFDSIGDCPLQELRIHAIRGDGESSLIPRWTSRAAAILQTLTILHLDSHTFTQADLDLLSHFINLIELKCGGIEPPDGEISGSYPALARLRRLEIYHEADDRALGFICLQCPDLEQLHITPCYWGRSPNIALFKPKMLELLHCLRARQKTLQIFIHCEVLSSLDETENDNPNIVLLPHKSLYYRGFLFERPPQ